MNSNDPLHAVCVELPEWTVEQFMALPATISSIEDRMRHVIRFSRWNFEKQTGGPFAAEFLKEIQGGRLRLA